MAASDGLSDADWAIWEPFFPPERGRVGQPAKVSTRLFLDALLWMTGEGARWRALPERFGSWNTVWRRFARWRDQGVFEAAFAAMAKAGVAQERAQMLDSTVIRAHQHAAGARRVKGGREAQLSRSGDHAAASRTRNRVERLLQTEAVPARGHPLRPDCGLVPRLRRTRRPTHLDQIRPRALVGGIIAPAYRRSQREQSCA